MTTDEPLRLFFACVGNSSRSQMSQAFCEQLAAENVECLSGGTNPLGRVHEDAITVMDEIGIDIRHQDSTEIDEAELQKADWIATMGCGQAAMPIFEPYEVDDWSLDHPSSGDLDAYRQTRDEIRRRVRELLAEHDALADDV